MTIYFTADTHLGHANIIKYCRRPFSSAREMDEIIYCNWAAVVRPEDCVYHLGDVAWGDEAAIAKTAQRIKYLPGKKYLVPGNHDYHLDILADAFDEVLPALYEIGAQARSGHHRAVLCHYPLAAWNRSHHASLHVHGHMHGRIPMDTQRADAGVDVWNYYPVSLEELLRAMKHAPPHKELHDTNKRNS